jgi:hypothetical protein
MSENPTPVISSLPLLVLLVIVVFVYNFGAGLYRVYGLDPLPSFEFLYTATFLCGVVWWLKAEARTSAVKHVFCLGLLVGIGWMIIIPYHLFKTRGARGFIPLLALIVSFLAAYLSVTLVYMALSN